MSAHRATKQASSSSNHWWDKWLSQDSWAIQVSLLWILINLIQSGFTELFHDEAYYWMWSKRLAWGYAEHPPGVALLIWLGSSFISGELGVRLLPVLLGGGTLYLLLRMEGGRQPVFLLMLLLGMIEFHAGGFLAVPDAGFIFFVTLFFFFFQQYIHRYRPWHILALGLTIAAMLYNKYHGLMILGMVMLSQLHLLRKGHFWAIVGLAILLYSPALIWLWETDFATFKFHLLDRVARPWGIDFTGNYVLSQFLVAGPLMGILALPAAFFYKPETPFEKSLKWALIGVLGFLFLMSFRTWIEANWSASAFIPLILLAQRKILQKPILQRWLRRLFWPSLVIMLVFRIYLGWEVLPSLKKIRNEFHRWDVWAEEVASISQGHPVVFHNGYKWPSKYHFYTRKPAYVTNNFLYHRTQFEYWTDIEDQWQGDTVVFASPYWQPGFDTLQTAISIPFYYKRLVNFRTFNQVEIMLQESKLEMQAGDTLNLSITLVNHHPVRRCFNENPGLPVQASWHLFDQGKRTLTGPCSAILDQCLDPGENLEIPIKIAPPASPGDYKLFLSLQTGWMLAGINGHAVPLSVRPTP